MARPKKTKKTKLSVYVPEDLAVRAREKLKDPMRNKTGYGEMSELVSSFLVRWLNEDNISNL